MSTRFLLGVMKKYEEKVLVFRDRQNKYSDVRLWACLPLGWLKCFFHLLSICYYLVNVCLSTEALSVHFPMSTCRLPWAGRCSAHFPLPATQLHTRMSAAVLRDAEASGWSVDLEEVPSSLPCQMWHRRILGPWEVASLWQSVLVEDVMFILPLGVLVQYGAGRIAWYGCAFWLEHKRRPHAPNKQTLNRKLSCITLATRAKWTEIIEGQTLLITSQR